ncbi:MAG: ketopantoate reductase C-terminal domain-containing protein [Bacillota bacterium]|nr:ketopantoate reductase C-terminal domain-containing protein [Bacillota bacterium]
MWQSESNVGVNQTVVVYRGTYGDVQVEGEAQNTMIAAMREVIPISEKERVPLTEEDINYWIKVIKSLHPDGRPSLAQDIDARRPTEVELFSGTVIRLGKKHHIPTPVNQFLYNRIKAMEKEF